MRATDEMFPGRCDIGADPAAWAGLRSATPTSRPIIVGTPRWPNLFLNVGHGALGLTLAMGSAQLAAVPSGAGHRRERSPVPRRAGPVLALLFGIE